MPPNHRTAVVIPPSDLAKLLPVSEVRVRQVCGGPAALSTAAKHAAPKPDLDSIQENDPGCSEEEDEEADEHVADVVLKTVEVGMGWRWWRFARGIERIGTRRLVVLLFVRNLL